MLEIGTSGSMSGEGKRGVAKWPKLPRLSSTLPFGAVQKSRPPDTFAAAILYESRRERSYSERGNAPLPFSTKDRVPAVNGFERTQKWLRFWGARR